MGCELSSAGRVVGPSLTWSGAGSGKEGASGLVEGAVAGGTVRAMVVDADSSIMWPATLHSGYSDCSFRMTSRSSVEAVNRGAESVP